MTSRLRHRCISQAISQQYVPVYSPPCCPTPSNTDPRRTEAYCPPTRSFSEPLSHAEYLRRLKANNTAPLSSTNALVQYGEGEYRKTIWTESTVGGACCPVNPTAPAAQKYLDAGMHTMMKGAKAAAVKGINDKNGVPESLHTLQKQGQAIFTEQCPGVSCQEQFPPEPKPPVVIQYTYLSVQRSTGNFMYYVFDEFYNQWSFITDSGFDNTYAYSSAGYVGNKFYTVFTKNGAFYYQFIDLKGNIVNQFSTPESLFFSTSGASTVILYQAYSIASAPTTLQFIRYEPESNTLTQTSQIISSFTNLFIGIYYNLILVRYRSSDSPVVLNHALWPITQTTLSTPAYVTSVTPAIYPNTVFGSTTGTIFNNTHFAFNSDGQSIIIPISGLSVTVSSFNSIAGAGPAQKGRNVILFTRGSYLEGYVYDYDTLSLTPIPLNPTQRLTNATNMAFVSSRLNTYNSGILSLPSNSVSLNEVNSASYTNAITLANVITAGNYTDISGAVNGGRSFYLSRIAYNTYYQEPDFGYITGNNNNPVATLLKMTNGSTWIQASGTISGSRAVSSVSNLSGSYSLNQFFTVETLVPILEPNDPTTDLPVTTNALNERSWWSLHQDNTRGYYNTANTIINQGTLGMIIQPRNNTQIVRQIQFMSGSVTSLRDPLTFTLEGSNDNGATYTTIVANANTNISADARYYIYSSTVFANSSTYTQYRLTFPTLRSGTQVQVQKVQFLAEAPAGYLVNGSVNASLTLQEGQTYEFKVNAPNDIFWIQTVPAPYSAANVYNTGVINNGCKSSILRFTVPVGAPATLYYVSQTDPTKTGTLSIVSSGAPTGNIIGSWWSHTNFNASQRTFSEIWFTIENAAQWGTSGISVIQDTRPAIAPASGSPYRYVMGITGQNYLFGKLLYIPNTVGILSGSTIQTIVQQYVQNLFLYNTFSDISLPKLYSHITPTTANTLPAFGLGVLTLPNGFVGSSANAITFNITAYNNITLTGISSSLTSSATQTFNLWYRVGGVQHIPGSPPVIDSVNGWIQIWNNLAATPSLASTIHNTLYVIPISLSLAVAAGQTIGLCLHSSSPIIHQVNSIGSSQQFFENNDFRVTTGDNAGYAGSVGPATPFTPTITPRSFAGQISAVRSTVNDSPTLTPINYFSVYRIGSLYTLLGTETQPRSFVYNTPTLYTNSISTINYNNKEYICIIETDQYSVKLRIIRSVADGDLLVTLRENMILIPSTFSQSVQINAFNGYVYVDINYQGTQRNYAIVRLTDGVIVASGMDPGITFSYIVTGRILMRLNSNNTLTMFRNGILETSSTTYTNIVRMRSDSGYDDALFAYSTSRALALTVNGYNEVTFPVAMTTINSTILANNCLMLIQLNPLLIYVVDRNAALYSYSLAQTTTLIRRVNTDQSMTVHVTYATLGPSSSTYILRLTDQFSDGWNGAQMELRQGATVITTIGPTFTSGGGPLDISVTLTAGLSYSLVWTVPGLFPEECGVQILNPSGTSIYQMAFGSQALVGTTLTSFTAQSIASQITNNVYVTYDIPTTQFYTNTTTETISNLVSNFIYQPA